MQHDVTQDDSGTTLSMDVGDMLSVRLAEIGGTAFEWHIVRMGGMVLISNKLQNSSEHTLGAATVREIKFTAATRGSHEVELLRHRRWETPQQADAHFNLGLTIK